MRYHDIQITGSLNISGSITIPVGGSNKKPTSPPTGSIFLEVSDSGSNLVVFNGSGSTGYQQVGVQTVPVAPPTGADIEYIVAAGGGGGGARAGGGGGAGGYLSSSLSTIESGSSITVTVGSGGSAGTGGANGQNGGDGGDSSIASAGGTSFSTVTSTGGGGGGGADASGATPSGGSGGGASYSGELTGGSGTVGQGFDGGDSTGNSGTYPYKAGGGGGASEVGADGNVSAGTGGAGGDGKQSNITGTLTYYAGGGGGGTHNPAVNSGAGGQGGGGAAGASGGKNVGTAGTANTGGGGGGGSTDTSGASTSNGAAGGSGVVILAYPTASISATGGLRKFFNNRVAHIFESSGTFSVSGPKTYNHNTLDIFGDSSCIALYNFDGNANDTGGNYNGTASNITYNQGYINDGAVFNGSSSVITLPSTLSDGSTTDATCISFWFNVGAEVTSATSNNEIMNFAQSSGNFGKIALGSTTGNFGSETFSVTSDVTSQYTYSTTNIPAGWNHAVVQWNSSTTKWDIYINSSQHSTSTFGTNEQGKWALKFGNRSSFYYSGKLDQIRIFSKTLSTAEITTLYEE